MLEMFPWKPWFANQMQIFNRKLELFLHPPILFPKNNLKMFLYDEWGGQTSPNRTFLWGNLYIFQYIFIWLSLIEIDPVINIKST